MSFYAFVPGDPHGKGSVRVGKWGAYKDEKTETYMGVAITVMRAAKTEAPMSGPLSVDIAVWCRRPKTLVPKGPRQRNPPSSAPVWCVTKPDLDNVAKTLLDCLVQSGVIEDDKSIVRLTMTKRYVALDAALGCVDVGVAVAVTAEES